MKEYDLRFIKKSIYSDSYEDIKHKTIHAENESEAIDKALDYCTEYEFRIGASRFISEATIRMEDGDYHNLNNFIKEL